MTVMRLWADLPFVETSPCQCGQSFAVHTFHFNMRNEYKSQNRKCQPLLNDKLLFRFLQCDRYKNNRSLSQNLI